MSRTFQLTVAYDGTAYAGWQIQPRAFTIQGMLERAFVKITKERINVTGSGRTDAGVHAIAQVASCTVPNWRASTDDLRAALNTHLPSDIVVTRVRDAPDSFHAIRDAIGKRYRYQLQVGGIRSPFDFRYRWQIRGPIDLNAMSEAAAVIVGRQDFASFQAAGSDRKTTVRHVVECALLIEPSDQPDVCMLACEIEANGFLYNMVRNIVGTLVEVGRGKQPVSWVREVLDARDRTHAGPTAPPQGLFLQRVDYLPFTDVGPSQPADTAG